MSERAPSHRAQVFSDQRANQKALIRKDYLGSARDRSAPAHVQTTLQIKQISISCSEIKQKESCLFQREPSERFPMPVKHEFKRPMLMKTLVALNDAHGTYSMHRLVARSVGRHACMHACIKSFDDVDGSEVLLDRQPERHQCITKWSQQQLVTQTGHTSSSAGQSWCTHRHCKQQQPQPPRSSISAMAPPSSRACSLASSCGGHNTAPGEHTLQKSINISTAG